MFLITNWKPILAVILTAGLCYLLHALDVDRLEKKEARDIAAQQSSDTKSCDADKAITTGVSHAYEDKITALNNQLTDLQRVRPNVCVTVATSPTSGRHATAFPNQPAGQDAKVDSDALYSLAGEGEKYRLQLIACQQFITETWQEQAAKQQ